MSGLSFIPNVVTAAGPVTLAAFDPPMPAPVIASVAPWKADQPANAASKPPFAAWFAPRSGSSLTIVPIAVASASVAFTGFDNSTCSVSFDSKEPSPTTGTETVPVE